MFPLSSNIGQSVNPLSYGICPKISDALITLTGYFRSIYATTASFSTGSREHVEYTILPLFFVMSTALLNKSI